MSDLSRQLSGSVVMVDWPTCIKCIRGDNRSVAQTPGFWQEVKAQAVAGMVVALSACIAGGIGYLIHTVPRQLDKVLDNQQVFKGRLEDVERQMDDVKGRVIKLEAER